MESKLWEQNTVHCGTLQGCLLRPKAKNTKRLGSKKARKIGWRQHVWPENTKLTNVGKVCSTRIFWEWGAKVGCHVATWEEWLLRRGNKNWEILRQLSVVICYCSDSTREKAKA